MRSEVGKSGWFEREYLWIPPSVQVRQKKTQYRWGSNINCLQWWLITLFLFFTDLCNNNKWQRGGRGAKAIRAMSTTIIKALPLNHLIESCRVFERGYHGLTIEEERKIVEVYIRKMTASAQTNRFPNYKSWTMLLQLVTIRWPGVSDRASTWSTASSGRNSKQRSSQMITFSLCGRCQLIR